MFHPAPDIPSQTASSIPWNKRPFLISGPCSAETEDQVMETARRLQATGKVDLFRAGIWKPRTRPGMFEGMGAAALPWLMRVKRETGLPTLVEVATPEHLELALQYEVDAIWLGARTTVNPFSVQALADALSGVHIPVFIKNPINPDLELWSGAVERLLKAGIAQPGLIHRGFSSYTRSDYRNAPMWQLPIEMRRRYPGLLMICDPSHICGNREGLQGIAQKSIDLDFDGLMIESHIDPDQAWSDARQQVTPEAFGALLDSLIWRSAAPGQPSQHQELLQIRERIDQIDDELLDLLAQRMRMADRIGSFKKENNVTILQTHRWNEILHRALERASIIGLSQEFIIRYFDAVHMESIRHQNDVMNEGDVKS